jgi:hypothetical protein
MCGRFYDIHELDDITTRFRVDRPRDLSLPFRKLNGVEPQAWLTDVLERVVSGRTKAHELGRLLPWAWKAERLAAAVHA